MAYNLGINLFANYLQSASFSLGYNYTFVELKLDSEVDENIFRVGGRYTLPVRAMSGELSLEIDAYAGEYTVTASPVVGTSESTDIAVIHPQLSYINFSRTFYLDLGYAYSEYDSDSFYDVEVGQISPTIGFGWNSTSDWVQLRGYFISIEQQTRLLNDDEFASAELSYTHWFERKAAPFLDNVRLALLAGERVLAVDPYAKAVNSVNDKETGAVSAAAQWTLSQSLKLMLLTSYEEYQNDVLADDYESVLVYGNIQGQW